MRALITGAAGFLGRHLTGDLVSAGADVTALTSSRPSNVVAGVARTVIGDLTRQDAVARLIAETQPTHVFHLAGVLGAPGVSAETLLINNVLGTAVLLDALADLRDQPVVVMTSSSAVYGDQKLQPVTEDAPFQPRTDYAVSKVGQEMAGIARTLGRGLPLIRLRPFNMIGPGQPESLMASRIARQVVRAELGGEPVVRLRSLAGLRDFVDVRDVARACVLVARSGRAGEVYNVCSGTERSVSDVVEVFRQYSRVPFRIEVDRNADESGDVTRQAGSYSRLGAATGWEPRVSFETSLHDLLDDWRAKEEGE